MLKPAVGRHLARRRAGQPGEFYEALVAAADYFRDVGLHCQLTIKMDPEIRNGLRRTDHRGASIQR